MYSLHLVHGRHLGCFPVGVASRICLQLWLNKNFVAFQQILFSQNTRNAGSAVNLSTEEARIAKNLINTQKLTKEKRLLRVSAVICGAFILLFTPSLVVNLLPERWDTCFGFSREVCWKLFCGNKLKLLILEITETHSYISLSWGMYYTYIGASKRCWWWFEVKNVLSLIV